MFGNWSKRRRMVKDAENYLKATDVVSRPMAVFMTVFLCVVIGLLLVSVFLGGRWTYHKIKGNDGTVSVVTTKTDGPGESANTENKQQEFPPFGDPSSTTNPAPFTTTAPAASTTNEPSTSPIISTGPVIIPDTGPDESQP